MNKDFKSHFLSVDWTLCVPCIGIKSVSDSVVQMVFTAGSSCKGSNVSAQQLLRQKCFKEKLKAEKKVNLRMQPLSGDRDEGLISINNLN